MQIEIGDEVTHLHSGVGVVSEISPHLDEKVHVRFNSGAEEAFDEEGWHDLEMEKEVRKATIARLHRNIAAAESRGNANEVHMVEFEIRCLETEHQLKDTERQLKNARKEKMQLQAVNVALKSKAEDTAETWNSQLQEVQSGEVQVCQVQALKSKADVTVTAASGYDSAEEAAIRRKAKRRKRLNAKAEKKALQREEARLEAEEREANVALRAKQNEKMMVQREKRRAKALRLANAAAPPLAIK